MAILGAGYIADWHAEAIRMTPGLQLAAVCDLSEDAARHLAAAHGAQAFASLDALLQSGAAEAICILTPPDSHAPLARKCLQAGLHCLVEKPVALSAEECRDLQAVAKDAGRVLAAGHNFLALPGYERLKQQVQSGALGRITSVDVAWHLPLTPLRSGPFGLWFLRHPHNLLYEIGPHPFSFAVDLCGPLEISHLSLGKPVALPGGAERPQSWRVLARAGHIDVTLSVSLSETAEDRSVTLRGTTGQARFDYGNDVLVTDAANTSDIIVNPLRRQLALAAGHLREGAVNALRQARSLNRKSPYGLSFQRTAAAFAAAISDGAMTDSRFTGAAAGDVMQAVGDTLALMPAQADPAPAPAKPRTGPPDALVIGGTGFIGQALTRALAAEGKSVRVLSRGSRGPFPDLAGQVEIMQADLTSREALERAMEGVPHVYHLGRSVDSAWEDCLKNDVGVTRTIAEAALAQSVQSFVYTGTIASYDMSDGQAVITEDSGFGDLQQRNLYARSKAACEEALMELHRSRGLPLVITRPGIVVGKGGPLQHWGIGRWHDAGAVRLWNHGRNKLPFVLVDDVARGLILAAGTPAAAGQSFNLTGDPMLSAQEYFDEIHAALGARITVKPGRPALFFASAAVKAALKRHVLRRPGVIRESLSDWKSRGHEAQFDNSRARTVLGWEPESSRAGFIRAAITGAGLFGF
jgi:predicted dehydrogenase/nucleoside-diphosphate-sugar epimerase